MKVLLGHNFYRSSAPSGEDAVFRNEQELLRDHGVDVVPYEVFNDHLDTSSLTRRITLALETAWSRDTYQAVSQLIRRTRPDIAHFHNTFPQISPSAYAACRDNGVPVVQTLHNFRFICPGGLLLRDGRPCEDCVGTNLLPAMRHRCYRASLPATGALVWMLLRNRWQGTYQTMVDRYVALTEFAASRLIAGGLPKGRLSIKPNFVPGVSSAGSGDGGFAVFVGRLSAEKGLRTLIAAWEYLPGIPLKIIGDGPLRQELMDVVLRKNLPIQFLGFCDRTTVLHTVGDAAIQLIPSECYEGFPMVVLEAYACGTPLVCSRIGSLDEIVREGETGMKFRAGDAADLAQTVKRLLNNPTILLSMRHKARAAFLTHYTSEHNFHLLMEIYHRTLADACRTPWNSAGAR
ncbi:MAG: glycosyltransferase [Nitrospira sp.]|nr:glycosyltransferase [Nitrospira sp.]